MKIISLSKTREFHLTYTTNLSPCSDLIFVTSVTDTDTTVYETKDKSFQLFVMSCIDFNFEIIYNSRTKGLND